MVEEDPNGHVNYLTFGLDEIKNREPLHRLITTTKRMDGFTAAMALREVYETQYGMFNHHDPVALRHQPLALVEMHRQEDPFSYSMAFRYYYRFRMYEIHKQWGCSLGEFLNLPFPIAEAVFRIEQMLAIERNRRLEAQAQAEKDQANAARGR